MLMIDQDTIFLRVEVILKKQAHPVNYVSLHQSPKFRNFFYALSRIKIKVIGKLCYGVIQVSKFLYLEKLFTDLLLNKRDHFPM